MGDTAKQSGQRRGTRDEEPGLPFLWAMDLPAVAVYATDANGRLAYYNEAAAELWGERPQLGELEPNLFARASLREDSRELAPSELPLSAALSGSEPLNNCEMTVGSTGRKVLVSADVLKSPSGEPIGALAVMQDVTAIRQASQIDNSGDPLSPVTHELRTPLTIIKGMAGLMQRRWDALPEDSRAMALEDLLRSERRMERAVENMLVLARLDHEDVELEPVLFQRALDTALAEHQEAFPGSTVNVSLPSPGPIMVGVEDWVRRILVNLLSNAEQYGTGAPPPLLTAAAEGPLTVVRVCSAGQPLEREEYDRIFEPFYRRIETANEVPGVGLGLTVARRLAEAQGGWLAAGPCEDGQGTRFMLQLPAAAPPPDPDIN